MSLEYSSVLILWIILPLFFQSSFTGVVHQLYSSISTAGRTHGCAGELLAFTCTTTGAWMEWKLAVGAQTYQEQFLYTDEVNKVLTDSSLEDITAILLEIHVNMTSGEGTFTSVIFIKLTNNTMPGNITCSSRTDNATLHYGIAETPQPPEITTITQLGTPDTNNNSTLYRIQWLQPNNMEAFDLDHYELIVGNHTMNIDAKENVIIIPLFTEKEAVVANIMAVDRCGKKSINSSKAFSGLLKSSGLCNTTRSIVCTCVKEVVAITLPVSVVAVSLGIIISAVVTWRVCFRQPKVHSKKSTSSATNMSREDLCDIEAEEQSPARNERTEDVNQDKTTSDDDHTVKGTQSPNTDRNSGNGIQTTALKPEGSVPKNPFQIRLRTASMSSSLTGSYKSKRDSQNIEAVNLISEPPEVDFDYNGQ